MMVGAARIEPARVAVPPTRVQVWRVYLSATLRLSSYGRCPPREGDHESPSHWSNPRARPNRRLAYSRRLGHRVKAASSFRLLSGFQAEDCEPRKPLGLNAFHAAAWCCSCLARYAPGAALSMRSSSTNLTSVERSDVILSADNWIPLATSEAPKACARFCSRNPITRSVNVCGIGTCVSILIGETARADGSSVGSKLSISASIAC